MMTPSKHTTSETGHRDCVPARTPAAMDAGHGDGGESSGGGWFRSEEMVYVSVILQRHVAHDALGRIGELGAVQFQDVRGVPVLSAVCVVCGFDIV